MIAATTAKLIEVARRAFAEQGYAEASMDAICAEAGLTRGALYHHFGGKEGLFEAVVRRVNEEVNARLEARFARYSDIWDGFRACNIDYLRLALEPEFQRIVLRDAPAVLGDRLRSIDAEGALDPIRQSLAALMDQGRLVRCDPEALARILNGAILDAAIWIANSPDPDAALPRASGAIEAMLDGLRRPAP
jgi:AcrR family transcriptional regulator